MIRSSKVDEVLPVFADFSNASDEAVALWDDRSDQPMRYGELRKKMQNWSNLYSENDIQLVFLCAHSTTNIVAAWIAALNSGVGIGLVNPDLGSETHLSLIDHYSPDCLIGFSGALSAKGYYHRKKVDELEILLLNGMENLAVANPALALLLFTSGSTGDPKAVRLSRKAVFSNARNIVHSLSIDVTDRALCHLPLHYSYGMSVVHSHLLVGASVVLTNFAIMQPRLWEIGNHTKATSFPGVPTHYELLAQLNFNLKEKLPSLQVLTQAGAKLGNDLVQYFSRIMHTNGGRFYVMYGQTEAGPRMSCIEIKENTPIGSVGYALQDGNFHVLTDNGRIQTPFVEGEIVYIGPNVMMGYAFSRDDLVLGDELKGVLKTGDIGYLDAEGRLFITGRSSRFVKVAGIRISLDYLTKLARSIGGDAAVVHVDSKLHVFWTQQMEMALPQTLKALYQETSIPKTVFVLHQIQRIPILSSGKTDYASLMQMSGLKQN